MKIPLNILYEIARILIATDYCWPNWNLKSSKRFIATNFNSQLLFYSSQKKEKTTNKKSIDVAILLQSLTTCTQVWERIMLASQWVASGRRVQVIFSTPGEVLWAALLSILKRINYQFFLHWGEIQKFILQTLWMEEEILGIRVGEAAVEVQDMRMMAWNRWIFSLY